MDCGLGAELIAKRLAVLGRGGRRAWARSAAARSAHSILAFRTRIPASTVSALARSEGVSTLLGCEGLEHGQLLPVLLGLPAEERFRLGRLDEVA